MGLETLGLAALTAGASAYGAHRNAKTQEKANQQNATATLYDPTNPMLQPLTEQQVGFLGNLFAGGNPFSQHQSPLQGAGQNAMLQQLGQPSPESQALGAASPFLQGLMGGGPLDFSGLGEQMKQFAGGGAPSFGGASASHSGDAQTHQAAAPTGYEAAQAQAQQAQAAQAQLGDVEQLLFGLANQGALQNPFADMGAFNQAQQVNAAAQPLFEQNLARAQGELASQAPGRFSSAFVQQGQDLASQALRDFNLFQQQNLMQGLELQNQQQQQALNFMLGSRGLQQEAALGATGQLSQGRLANTGFQQQANLANAQLGTQVGLANAQAQNDASALLSQLQNQTALQNAQMANQVGLGNMQARNQVAMHNAALANAAGIASMQQAGMSQGQMLNALLGLGQLQLGAQDLWGSQGLQAANTLGSLAGQQGMNEFNRALGTHGAGLDAFTTQVNPLLALMQSGLQYGMPSDLNALVGVNNLTGPAGEQAQQAAQQEAMRRQMLSRVRGVLF